MVPKLSLAKQRAPLAPHQYGFVGVTDADMSLPFNALASTTGTAKTPFFLEELSSSLLLQSLFAKTTVMI